MTLWFQVGYGTKYFGTNDLKLGVCVKNCVTSFMDDRFVLSLLLCVFSCKQSKVDNPV
jgi:hypothetical protein